MDSSYLLENEDLRGVFWSNLLQGGTLMAKRETGWTEKKIARYYKEGRGSGELGQYKPWLTIQDVPL